MGNTIANIDKQIYDNDKVILAYRPDYPDLAANGRDKLNINWAIADITIPTGNYNMSDLEFEMAKQIKLNYPGY